MDVVRVCFSDDPGRVSGHHAARGDVFVDETQGSDNNVVADLDVSHDHGARTDEYIVADDGSSCSVVVADRNVLENVEVLADGLSVYLDPAPVGHDDAALYGAAEFDAGLDGVVAVYKKEEMLDDGYVAYSGQAVEQQGPVLQAAAVGADSPELVFRGVSSGVSPDIAAQVLDFPGMRDCVFGPFHVCFACAGMFFSAASILADTREG